MAGYSTGMPSSCLIIEPMRVFRPAGTRRRQASIRQYPKQYVGLAELNRLADKPLYVDGMNGFARREGRCAGARLQVQQHAVMGIEGVLYHGFAFFIFRVQLSYFAGDGIVKLWRPLPVYIDFYLARLGYVVGIGPYSVCDKQPPRFAVYPHLGDKVVGPAAVGFANVYLPYRFKLFQQGMLFKLYAFYGFEKIKPAVLRFRVYEFWNTANHDKAAALLTEGFQAFGGC